jgi:poly(3-hydroxyalkanoate) synthetase
MCLRDFSCGQTGSPILICAPCTLHGALVADFASGHSIVEMLQRGGLERLYLTDWRSASAETRLFSIDSYLAELNVAVDEIGPPVDLIGLCQGGWLSLVYAARFPEKVRRLVLVGAPVDVSVESELSWRVAGAPHAAFDALVSGGGGLIKGQDMLRFWCKPTDPQIALQRNLSPEVAADQELLDRFDCWNRHTLDLPGTYYLQVVDWIFRENRLAKGRFVALGREIKLQRLEVPVFLLAGAEDEVVPADQVLATAALLGTPRPLIETAIAPSLHLGLFMGARTLAAFWPRIARWLQGGGPGQLPA